MSRFIEDADGDHMQVIAEQEGALHGVTIAAAQRDEDGDGSTWHHATVGPVDPHALIEAIKAECEMHEDDEVHDSPLRALEPDEEPESREQYVHITPATAEEPRLWAGADEPIIDSLIGRVADLEEKAEEPNPHSALADLWDRRLNVVSQALTMIPDPGKMGGLAGALNGNGVPQKERVPLALKIARFAADEHRDIPGVD